LARHTHPALSRYPTLFRSADAYYLYNPFGENLSGDAPTAGDPSRAPDHIDDEFPRDEAAFLAGVRATERLLKQARPGTQLITFKDRKSTRLNSSHVKISYA